MSGSQATHEELAEAIDAAFSPLDEDIRERDEKFQTEQAAARERAEREFVITKQHRRFAEFCDAVRRDIGNHRNQNVPNGHLRETCAA